MTPKRYRENTETYAEKTEPGPNKELDETETRQDEPGQDKTETRRDRD